MTLLLSTYTNKLDKKGRISVPAPFRAALTTENFAGIIAYGSFVNPCVEACGMARIESLSASIDELDPYSDERNAFAAVILGGSIQLPFDPEGRVTLPEELISLAVLSEQACFVGKGATFEIWQPELLQQYLDTARNMAKDKRSLLRLQTPKNKQGE